VSNINHFNSENDNTNINTCNSDISSNYNEHEIIDTTDIFTIYYQKTL